MGSGNTNTDRISYLPDPIRSHIVSFLPMKDAMRTSILSKKWKHVCSSLSRLEFNQSDITGTDFVNFVDEMLFRHDGSDIQRFCLKINLNSAYISSRRISMWISFALRHNVQDLELFINHSEIARLPFDLFTCSTIRELSLNCFQIEWPTILRFPVLRKLYIEELSFENEDTFHKLISSSTSPMLEDLEIQSCFLGCSHSFHL
ncbi:hypothetical protein AQUCO_05700071v1 [Aquilegia coerulea]|uniref:F-box domain-containing protein n=1 Tax=Aquilegia coerulea TaxID=218851 RepID=A0A2G5CFR5_AQUCA|nr:hypothetical protein AQUCO_05700071v1 [Aquilegia coerulea]